MSKRSIRILATIMAIALAGLIGIQTQYFISARDVKKEQFNHSVNRALSAIVDYLEEKENISDIQKSLGLDIDKSQLEKIKQQTGKDYIDIDQKVRFYIDKNETQKPTVSTYFNIFEKDSLVYSVNDSQFKHKKSSDLSSTAHRLQQELRQKVLSKNYTLRQMASRITFSRRNLKDKIKGINIPVLIAEKLEDNGIKNQFEFAIKEDNKFIQLSNHYLNQKTNLRFKKRLYPRDVMQNNSSLHIIFPKKYSFFTDSLFLLIPSLLVSILLLLTCAVTIYVIFKQKRLSTIKNDFINNMTHELKTPISTISLASEMLKDGSVSNSENMINHISKIITDESTRLTNQIEKVLQMAVFSEARLKLKLKNINIHQLLNELLVRSKLKIEDRGGSLEVNLNAYDDLIYADEVHVTNIITNLIDNAIKYCNSEPLISITTENKNRNIHIQIKDNGIGIAKKDHKLIFERFYRVSTGNVHDVKGFGLGLSYVKKIIEAHEGSIFIESSLGKGSIFTIVFPLSEIHN